MSGITLHPFMLCGMDFPTLSCLLLIYGVIGWAYESSVFSLAEQGKFMNRGCFVGPYCPIYAVISISSIYLLQGIESPFRIMLLSSILVCAIEYVTSWGLEKLFHARYWDYSYYPLNINGRISVVSGAFFGLAVLFLNKILHPALMDILAGIPYKVKFVAAVTAWSVFLIDIVFTTVGMLNLNRKCKELYDAVDSYMESQFDSLNNKKEVLKKFRIVRQGQKIVIKAKGVNKMFLEFETRYLKSVPDFHSTTYGDVIEKMKKVLSYNGKARLAEFDKEDFDDMDDDLRKSEDENENVV